MNKLNTNCIICNKSIYRKPNKIKKQKVVTCSISCRNKVYRNKPQLWRTGRTKENNPNWKGGKEKYKIRRLLKKYNCSQETFDEIHKTNKGFCAICKKHQSELKQPLNIDHNHKTGEIRGLLCIKCNQGLGMFNDDRDLLIKAANYLY